MNRKRAYLQRYATAQESLDGTGAWPIRFATILNINLWLAANGLHIQVVLLITRFTSQNMMIPSRQVYRIFAYIRSNIICMSIHSTKCWQRLPSAVSTLPGLLDA